MRITIELNYQTLAHVSQYIKSLYHEKHGLSETVEPQQCLHCSEFLTTSQKALREAILDQKIEEGRLAQLLRKKTNQIQGRKG